VKSLRKSMTNLRNRLALPAIVLAAALPIALALEPGSFPKATLVVASALAPPAELKLPRIDGSLRFAVIGDFGRGTREQYEVAAQMALFHKEFPFTFVITLGDNIYGSDTPADMIRKFETPYKPLLDAGVVFQASLGNHDNPNQRFYKLFNMGGERYYTFRPTAGGVAGNVRFFALDTNYLDKVELDWIEKEMQSSISEWKIAYFHHPLYSSGITHGSALETRALLEPLFIKYGVSAAFAGHDHFYERIKPQKGGIGYWVSGGAGSLRKRDIRASDMTAKGFDSDYHFMLIEIIGEDMHYQAISRSGATVDSGVFRRPGAPLAAPKAAATPVAAPTPGR
jgi:hypothetical protein